MIFQVKGIVVKSMDDILQRGENIESLMTKSADLSSTSVQFYRTAKKNNQCCQVRRWQNARTREPPPCSTLPLYSPTILAQLPKHP